MTLIENKFIEPIEVVELYDTGVVKLYRSNGLEFCWHSWVLAEVAWASSNPVHLVIATKFHSPHRKVGIINPSDMSVSYWNPSYDVEYNKSRGLNAFWYFKPIQVIHMG